MELALQADDDPEELVASRIWNNRKNKAFARDLGIDDQQGFFGWGLTERWRSVRARWR